VNIIPEQKEPFKIVRPNEITTPIVVSSPHSGNYYPISFQKVSAVNIAELKISEDCFIDELFESSISIGAPMIKANYARSYIDLNREPYELDQEMFIEQLPGYINTESLRVASGLGTIAKLSGNQKQIYNHKINLSDALDRIHNIYKPYHKSLGILINEAIKLFGFCILLDCHSMPTIGATKKKHPNEQNKLVVLGDLNGVSCSDLLTEKVESIFNQLGYMTKRNNPYAGGFTTEHYGNPIDGVHALQIELNKGMYLNEVTHTKTNSFLKVKDDLYQFLKLISKFCIDNRPILEYQRLSAE